MTAIVCNFVLRIVQIILLRHLHCVIASYGNFIFVPPYLQSEHIYGFAAHVAGLWGAKGAKRTGFYNPDCEVAGKAAWRRLIQ